MSHYITIYTLFFIHFLIFFQHLQFAAASYVTGCYVRGLNDVSKIGWLPVKERRDFHLLTLVFKALYSDAWPSNLKINEVVHTRLLPSNAMK